MKSILYCLLLTAITQTVFAGRISGIVKDEKGQVLAFASVLVKGTTRGTTAGNDGRYYLDLDPGTYTISAQFVGYEKQEQKITVTGQKQELNFVLKLLQLEMKEVVVRAGAEDPAYEIIRNAIKKRKDYEEPLDSFTCEAYIKTFVKSRKIPRKVFGQKIEDSDRKSMGVDSIGKGVLFLSESLTKVAYKKPKKIKLEVLSGRESGSSGFGFNFPTFINFYNNNVSVFTSRLNPRGFVSPIAESALGFYRYQYLGSFWEDGREINQIKVIPRRKYEPLFFGTINITEGDWRIHSLELSLTKESQLELIDTLRIRQIQVPVTNEIWQAKDQVVHFVFSQFGFDLEGNFLNVYNKYDINPSFSKKYFNNVVVKYDTTVNKRSKEYWDSIRPVALEIEELRDYQVKDSAYQYRRDSVWSRRNIDSMRRQQGKITLGKFFWSGFRRSNFSPTRPWTFTWNSPIKNLQYNTVEGVAMNLGANLQRNFPGKRQSLVIEPRLRYGFSNGHLNGSVAFGFNRSSFNWAEDGGTTGRSSWRFEAGKRVLQFNRDNPIRPLLNSVYTLFYKENYMKIYENWFAELKYSRRFDNSLRVTGSLLYEDRLPIENTTDFSFFRKDKNSFTPNYPFEKISQPFTRHQAVIAGVEMEFKPGQQYIQFPRGKMPIGSKYPTLGFQFFTGIPDLAGSDVQFSKWRFSVWDDINLKLRGLMKYRISAGGFLNRKQLYIQDFQHFNGNQLLFASDYLNSFQMAPYYANSTDAYFYLTGHLEHHFNGLLTNKIPLFRRLNWHLVGGSNAFFVNSNNNYVEVFGGIENIFKLFRVDVVASYLNGKQGQVGVRLGLGGLLGNSVSIGQ